MLDYIRSDLCPQPLIPYTMSDRIPDSMMNRRQLIAGLGCAYALGTSVSSAQEAQPMDRRDVQRILSEQYGERAAKAGSEIILSEWVTKEKKGRSYQQYRQEVASRLLSNPSTEQIARDVESRRSEINESRSREKNLSTPELGKAIESGTIKLKYSNTSTKRTGLGIPIANVINVNEDPLGPPDKAKVISEVTYYGTATAKVRMYPLSFRPDQTGSYKFSLRYFRLGKAVASGCARVSIYVSSFSGEQSEPIEQPIGTVEGTRNSSDSFELKKDKTYKVGVEFQTTATNAGSASLGDFKTDNRRFEPSPEFDGINPPEEPKTPELDWEFFG